MTERHFGWGTPEEQPPTNCPDCERRLGPPDYGDLARLLERGAACRGNQFYQHCLCGVLMVWSAGNVWRRTHLLPVMR
ncbi:MAG TPA: hypothetical protein VM531_09010 [Sphingomicrobium sp.]|jgi:hypothetical protein|nr:hypothetical protein [Sphingomicrobium sp.]